MFVNSYSNLTTSIASMNTVPLGNVYTYMNNTIAGDYNDPEPATTITIPSGPAAGTYANINAAFTDGLIPAANSAISNLVTAYSSINSSTTYTVNNVCGSPSFKVGNSTNMYVFYSEWQQ
jgi:hypothetical protein